MIPKSSQRSDASGLAAHLLNAHDNEFVEVMFLQGGIADDLTGWAREKEASFLALTKGQNPFYHVQISPDFRQAWNDDLTFDFVSRILSGVGLEGQDHALVRHIKQMPDGISREHFHLVVSRLDINECKAIPISFDHIKLQYITRDFARNHDLQLPPGYYNFDDRAKQTYRQQTLFEKKQVDRGLPSRKEHQEIVTPLWEGRVSPKGFIKALEYHGYMLAFGRRPVVVDIHGTEHSLAKLIDLKEAGVAAVREYLGEIYNEEDLPSVEDAKKTALELIEKTKAFERKEDHARQIKALKHGQANRHEKLKSEIEATLAHDKTQRTRFDDTAMQERCAHRSAFLEKRREIKAQREAAKPTGLAAFLGRVTGVALVKKKIHKHRDHKQYLEHIEARQEIISRQLHQSEELRLSHQMRALDAKRKERDLAYREAQELRSLEIHLEKQARLLARGIEPAHTPAPQLELSPFGRRAVPAKAMTRYTGSSYKDRATPKEFRNAAGKGEKDLLAPTPVSTAPKPAREAPEKSERKIKKRAPHPTDRLPQLPKVKSFTLPRNAKVQPYLWMTRGAIRDPKPLDLEFEQKATTNAKQDKVSQTPGYSPKARNKPQPVIERDNQKPSSTVAKPPDPQQLTFEPSPAPLPPSGELAHRFDRAAQFNDETQERSSGGGKTRAPDAQPTKQDDPATPAPEKERDPARPYDDHDHQRDFD